MKHFTFLLLLFLFSTCDMSSLENNDELIHEIDNLPFSECTVLLELDSVGNTIDTLSKTKIKVDEEGQEVFKRRTYCYRNQEFVTSTYYWDDKTSFLGKTTTETGDFKQYSETFKDKEGFTQELIAYTEFEGEKDTLVLGYDYEFTPTNKKSKVTLNVIKNDDAQDRTIIEYNEKEKMVKEIILIDNDTFTTKTYTYFEDKVQEIKQMKYAMDTTSTLIYHDYDDAGNLILETIHEVKSDSITKSKTIKSHYDSNNNWIGSLETDSSTNKLKRIKVEICKLNMSDYLE